MCFTKRNQNNKIYKIIQILYSLFKKNFNLFAPFTVIPSLYHLKHSPYTFRSRILKIKEQFPHKLQYLSAKLTRCHIPESHIYYVRNKSLLSSFAYYTSLHVRREVLKFCTHFPNPNTCHTILHIILLYFSLLVIVIETVKLCAMCHIYFLINSHRDSTFH